MTASGFIEVTVQECSLRVYLHCEIFGTLPSESFIKGGRSMQYRFNICSTVQLSDKVIIMSWSFEKEYIMENKIQIKKFAWKLEIYGSYKPHFKRLNSISVHFHTCDINNLASCANDNYEKTNYSSISFFGTAFRSSCTCIRCIFVCIFIVMASQLWGIYFWRV